MTGAAPGIIISEDGYIVTNAHVVEGADTVKVALNDGTEYEAKVLGYAKDNDIAVCKIDATGLNAATFGDSDTVEVGELAGRHRQSAGSGQRRGDCGHHLRPELSV